GDAAARAHLADRERLGLARGLCLPVHVNWVARIPGAAPARRLASPPSAATTARESAFGPGSGARQRPLAQAPGSPPSLQIAPSATGAWSSVWHSHVSGPSAGLCWWYSSHSGPLRHPCSVPGSTDGYIRSQVSLVSWARHVVWPTSWARTWPK